MKERTVLPIVLVMMAMAAVPVMGVDAVADTAATTAADAYALGDERLARAEFDAALEAYGEAARAADATAEQKRRYLQVRTLVKTRADIDEQTDPDKWWQMAARLRNYYYQFRLYDELEALARAMHTRRPTAGTASLLGDALLILDRNEEAEKTLDSITPAERTPQAVLLLGVAKARQGRGDEAEALLAEMPVPDPVSPRFLSDLARLQVLCGEAEDGLATLTVAFEKTAPAGLPGFRDYVKRLPEFGSVDQERFAEVMATESKVDASSCSGGDSCGSCPNRASCAGSQTQQP